MENTKKSTKKEATTKKPATKKVATEKKVVKKEVAPVAVEEVKPEIKEEAIGEIKPEEVKVPKKLNVSIPTIVLAISTIVLAIILVISQPKSNIDLTTIFPDVFAETKATLKLPKGFMLSGDSLEMFIKEDGLLTAKGMVTAATYSEDEYSEMKDVFIEQYGATEVEKEGYEVLTLTQENGEDVYLYYFIYKDSSMLQVVLLNCNESEANTILNGVSF